MLPFLLTICAVASGPIVVLPFEADAPDRALAEALSTWVATDLADQTGTEVLSRNELELAEQQGTLAEQVSRATTVVSGTLSRTSEAVSLVIRLPGSEDFHSTRPPADLGELQHQALSHIAQHLGLSATKLPAPTADLTALTSWGTGLAARRVGHLEHARHAFAAAVEKDPSFAWALRDRDLATQAFPAHRMRSAHDAIYARYPRATGPAESAEALVGVALRLMALEGDELHCQRSAEMLAFLQARSHIVALPESLTDTAFSTQVAHAARAVGLSAFPRSEVGLPDAAYLMPQRRVAGQFQTTADFLFREASARNTLGSGVFGALAQCHGPARAQEALAELGTKVLEAGLAGEVQRGRPAPGWTLRESLELGWAQLQAMRGPAPELERRLDLLVQGRPTDDPLHPQLLARAQTLREGARQAHAVRAGATGSTFSDLVALLRGAADDAVNVTRRDTPECAHALDSYRGRIYAWLSQVGTTGLEDAAASQAHLAEGQWLAGSLFELGCLRSEAGPAAYGPHDDSAVEARLAAMPPGSLATPECVARRQELEASLRRPPSPRERVDRIFAIRWLEQECR
jgi:hypothetical protein